MKHYFEIIVGLLLILIVAYVGLSIPRILLASIRFFEGALMWAFLLLGIGLLLLGLSDLKDALAK
ncbi:MAG: hypothetical protein Q8L27_04550 [archaeon]|nr:hypothetical protein [archaeon]